jgi:hypothetical protein
MTGAGTARADVIPPSDTWAEIFNPYLNAQGNTLCVDNPGGSRDPQKLQLWRCHGYDSQGSPQRWIFYPLSSYIHSGRSVTTYHLRNTASSLCAEIPETYPTDVDLIQWYCSDYPAVEWALEPVDPSSGNPDFQLETLEPRFTYVGHWCMAADNFSDSRGTRLVAQPCDPTDIRQLWNLG